MQFDIDFGKGVIALPEKTLFYLDKADHLTLKLFLLLAQDKALREHFDPAEVAKSFAVTRDKIEEAIAFWCNAGLLTMKDGIASDTTREAAEEGNRPPKVTVSVKSASNGERVTVVTSGMPNYSGKEIEAIMQGDPTLSLLIEECQILCGKVFGAREISRLLGMADYLRLGHDSILLLFTYAGKIDKCSVAYVEKLAAGLVGDGITTYAEIEGYIAAKEKQHTTEGVVRKLCGIKGRAFSTQEKRFIAKWTELDLSEELLTLAYEVTVNNTGNLSFPYMNKVLMNWREAGYTTPEMVNAAMTAYRQKKEEAQEASFNVDDFFAAALKHSTVRLETPRGE